MNAAEIVESLRDFASVDPARVSLNTPFGCDVFGKGYLAASDGHRAALVRSEEWQTYVRDNAPPLAYVLPTAAKHVGTIDVEALEPARYMPAKWECGIVLSADLAPRLTAEVVRGSGKKVRRITILNDVIVDWKIGLDVRQPIGIALNYLLDALDFVGMAQVHVWASDPFSPLAFTATSDPILDAKRLAVVMPMRV